MAFILLAIRHQTCTVRTCWVLIRRQRGSYLHKVPESLGTANGHKGLSWYCVLLFLKKIACSDFRLNKTFHIFSYNVIWILRIKEGPAISSRHVVCQG